MMNQGSSGGELLRATLFSRGNVHSTRAKYHASMDAFAEDVKNGVVMTTNEMVHNSEGGHCYFEVDWCSEQKLPTLKQIETLLQTMHDMLCDLLGDESAQTKRPFRIMVMCNRPTKQVSKKDGKPYIKFGLHFVIQDICVRSTDNRRAAALLNFRVCKAEPCWTNGVDIQPYKDGNASLRPIYSHKMDECDTCKLRASREREEHGDSTVGKKRKKLTSCNSLEQQLLVCNCGGRGLTVNANYYTLIGTVDRGSCKGQPIQFLPCVVDVREALRLTSIVPHGRHAPDIFEFVPTEDMPTETTLASLMNLQDSQLPSSSNRSIHGCHGVVLEPTSYPDHYGFINEILLRYVPRPGGEVRQLNIVCKQIKLVSFEILHGKIVPLKQSANIWIKVDGPDVGWCARQQRCHQRNGSVYYLMPCGLLPNCWDPVCKAEERVERAQREQTATTVTAQGKKKRKKKIVDPNRIPLNDQDKMKLMQLFYQGFEASLKDVRASEARMNTSAPLPENRLGADALRALESKVQAKRPVPLDFFAHCDQLVKKEASSHHFHGFARLDPKIKLGGSLLVG
jgi:hypothetical protein